MPLYEYRCNSCQHRVTVLVLNRFETATACPDCGSPELTRLFSSFSLLRAPSDEAVNDNILSDSKLMSGLKSGDRQAMSETYRRLHRGQDVRESPVYKEALEKIAGNAPLDEP